MSWDARKQLGLTGSVQEMRHITKVQAVFRARKVRQKVSMMKAPPPTADEDSHLYTPRPVQHFFWSIMSPYCQRQIYMSWVM